MIPGLRLHNLNNLTGSLRLPLSAPLKHLRSRIPRPLSPQCHSPSSTWHSHSGTPGHAACCRLDEANLKPPAPRASAPGPSLPGTRVRPAGRPLLTGGCGCCLRLHLVTVGLRELTEASVGVWGAVRATAMSRADAAHSALREPQLSSARADGRHFHAHAHRSIAAATAAL
jgi:hypothetical protein